MFDLRLKGGEFFEKWSITWGKILGFEKMVSNNIMGPHFRIKVCTNMLFFFSLDHDFLRLSSKGGLLWLRFDSQVLVFRVRSRSFTVRSWAMSFG